MARHPSPRAGLVGDVDRLLAGHCPELPPEIDRDERGRLVLLHDMLLSGAHITERAPKKGGSNGR